VSTVAPIHVHKLTQLKDLFGALLSGRHINRLVDHALWAELEREQSTYETLFDSLGYRLRVDGRGFAWFQTEESTSNVSKTTRQLALLFMLVFELQADTGLHLGRFTEWLIDRSLLAQILEKNRLLLEAEGLADMEMLIQLLKTASNYGFASADGSGWRLLSATYRYLDRFEELAQHSQQNGETGEDDEMPEEKV
jgi:hypothetical protein